MSADADESDMGNDRGLRRYTAMLVFAGLVLVGQMAVSGHLGEVTQVQSSFWVFWALMAVTSLSPIRLRRNGREEEIPLSLTFGFALALNVGTIPAVLSASLASVAADLIRRRPLWKVGTNMSQTALPLTAAGGTLMAVGHLGPSAGLARMSADQLPLVLVAGITFFLSHHLLLSAALGLDGEMSVWSCFRHDFLFHGGIHAVLLALSPTVVATASHSLVFMPLLLLPIATIHRAARISLAREHEACHDSLTGLPNRILFREKVEFALKESRRRHSKFAVMIVDLDGFKEVNDSLGHHNGDALLQSVASSLSRFLGPDTVVARLGGDEFGVLITSVSDDGEADRRARRLRDSLRSPYDTPGGVVDIDASIGVAVHPDHGDDYSVLMQRADVAMYLAKSGRSGSEIYSAERDPYTPRRLGLMGDIRRGIQAEEFVLHYQPKVRLGDGRVLGVEALLRWNHPRYGLVMPDEFITLAERSGLITPLTLYVVNEALRQRRQWREEGLDLTVAVNISVRSLFDAHFEEDIARLLRMWGAKPSDLSFEITESTVMTDPVRALNALSRLRQRGIRLSLDDFGTGYSSLTYLKELPVDEIKIDKSFVMELALMHSEEVIVHSTIDLARNLGLEVVAEGVDSEVAWEHLATLGCHYGQGYYLSRPIPPQQLSRLLVDSGGVLGAAAVAVRSRQSEESVDAPDAAATISLIDSLLAPKPEVDVLSAPLAASF